MTKHKEVLELAFKTHSKNERHRTVAETRYWCDQYKLLANTAIKALAQPEQICGFNVVLDESMPPNIFKLAQPEQEPVAYGMWDTMIGYGGRMMMVRLDKGQDGCTVPLYTPPPQRKRLTHEQRLDVMEKFAPHQNKWAAISIMIDLVEDAIEAANGIKGDA